MLLCVQIGQLVSDDPEEEKKQRVVQDLLNKLTPENFDKIIQNIVKCGLPGREDRVWAHRPSKLCALPCFFL